MLQDDEIIHPGLTSKKNFFEASDVIFSRDLTINEILKITNDFCPYIENQAFDKFVSYNNITLDKQAKYQQCKVNLRQSLKLQTFPDNHSDSDIEYEPSYVPKFCLFKKEKQKKQKENKYFAGVHFNTEEVTEEFDLSFLLPISYLKSDFLVEIYTKTILEKFGKSPAYIMRTLEDQNIKTIFFDESKQYLTHILTEDFQRCNRGDQIYKMEEDLKTINGLKHHLIFLFNMGKRLDKDQ